MASTSAALRRRRRAERMFKRAVRRIRRFFASYVSPLGWAVTGAGIACLIAFPFLGWYELLVFGIVAMVMMLAAIVLSLGNTRFHASIVVSNHRVTVGDTVSVIVGIDNTGRTPTTTARGYLPIGDAHERFNIPMLAPGQSKQTDVEFRTVSRAILPIGPLRIRKGDPFGLVRHEKELADRITVFIHPRTVRLDTLNAGVPRDLEGQPSGQIVDDDLDFYGLREYEPGHSSIGVKCLLQDRPLFCHAGNAHGQPRNAMEFLDNASAIEPDREDNPNLAEGTLKHSPDASFYFFTVGSLKDIEQIKRMTLALPRSASCVVLQASAGANRGIRRFANFTLATIGDLDDLPLIMGVLA